LECSVPAQHEAAAAVYEAVWETFDRTLGELRRTQRETRLLVEAQLLVIGSLHRRLLVVEERVGVQPPATAVTVTEALLGNRTLQPAGRG
jgi:hypothetical protein